MFSVCGAAADSLGFLVLGDWGGTPSYPYDTPFQTIVARQMAYITEAYNSSFNLALGDNFYKNGVKDVDDKRFIVSIYVITKNSTKIRSRSCQIELTHLVDFHFLVYQLVWNYMIEVVSILRTSVELSWTPLIDSYRVIQHSVTSLVGVYSQQCLSLLNRTSMHCIQRCVDVYVYIEHCRQTLT